MHISMKTEYAIRGLIELAQQRDDKPLAIRELCEKQNLPVKFMEQIFRKLKQAGLLRSIKGSQGGYILERSPDDLSLQEIMSAIDEEPARLNCCGAEGSREYCSGTPCDFYKVWGEIENELENHFSEIPLARFLRNREEVI